MKRKQLYVVTEEINRNNAASTCNPHNKCKISTQWRSSEKCLLLVYFNKASIMTLHVSKCTTCKSHNSMLS